MRFLWRKSPFSRGEELKLAQRGERFGTGKGTLPLHRTVGQLFQVWSGFFREFLCPKPKIKEQGCDSIFYMFVEEWLKPVSCSSPSQNCMCCNILQLCISDDILLIYIYIYIYIDIYRYIFMYHESICWSQTWPRPRGVRWILEGCYTATLGGLKQHPMIFHWFW